MANCRRRRNYLHVQIQNVKVKPKNTPECVNMKYIFKTERGKIPCTVQ